MLKGHVFLYQIFGNEIAAKLFNTLSFSKNGIFKDFEDEMEVTYNGTEVTVSSGVALIGGRPIQETSSTTIDAGTTSLYCKLCLTVDLDQENTTSQLNQAYYEIVTDVSDYPVLTQDDIVNNNSGKYQFELAQFTTGVSGIDDFVDSRTYINLEEISGVPTNAVMGFDGNTIPSGYEEVTDYESGIKYPTYTNGQDIGGTRRSYYYKSGNVGCVVINVINLSVTSGGSIALFTLPEGYRPAFDTSTQCFRIGGSTLAQVMIQQSGLVSIVYTTGAISTNYQICGNIIYYIG